ncbi:MAG TPA: DUF559 domain-containing protein [Chthonomonadaceae bacterium]|nr:DUF559 domain-containing protein [Chthonomonadaceae bacterium]
MHDEEPVPIDKSKIIFGPHAAEKRDMARRLRQRMTPSERRLWEKLRANRLARLSFRRQQTIDGFIVDFYCHTAGLIVEVDGAVHKEMLDYDKMRDTLIGSRGLSILRFSNDAIEQNMEAVLAQIVVAAQERIAKAKR